MPGKFTAFGAESLETASSGIPSPTFEPFFPTAELAAAAPVSGLSSSTAGISMRDAARRGLESVAVGFSDLATRLTPEEGVGKALKKHAGQWAEGVADAMSGAMEDLVDTKRMLFRTDGMFYAMNGFMGYIQGRVNEALGKDGARLADFDMKAFRAYVNNLTKSDEFAEHFKYNAQAQRWVLDSAFARKIALEAGKHLRIDLNGADLAYHLEEIVNAAVNSMETVALDKKDSIRLFFDEKYHAAMLAAKEGVAHAGAHMSHMGTVAGAHMTYAKEAAKANLAYAGAVAKANAKIAKAYMLKAGTALNQYLIQPAWRFITNAISTACLAADSIIELGKAIFAAFKELGGVGTGKETFPKTKAIIAGIKAEWKERRAEMNAHVDNWKSGKDAAMKRADKKIHRAKVGGPSGATVTIGRAMIARDKALKKAEKARDDAIRTSRGTRVDTSLAAMRAHNAGREELTTHFAAERLALGKAKAAKKVGQRTATALRASASVRTRDDRLMRPTSPALGKRADELLGSVFSSNDTPRSPASSVSPRTPGSPTTYYSTRAGSPASAPMIHSATGSGRSTPTLSPAPSPADRNTGLGRKSPTSRRDPEGGSPARGF